MEWHTASSRRPKKPRMSKSKIRSMQIRFFYIRLFLFPKLKNVLKGRHVGTLENNQKSVTDMLKTIQVEDFQRCNQKWEQRLHRCVAAQENYFGGDNIDVWKKTKIGK